MPLGLSLTAVFIGLAYAAWSIIGKAAGASGAWMGFLVMIVSIMMVGAFNVRELVGSSVPTLKILMALAFAGVINGYAIYLHSNRATDITVPTGIFVTTIFASMVIFSPFLSWILLGETLG